MNFSRKKSGGSQLNSLSQDATIMSNTCSYLSQIYLEQWEKNNNVEREVKESKDRGNANSDLQVKSLSEDKPVLPSSSAPLKEREVKKSKDQGNGNSDLQVKSLTEDKPVQPSSSVPLKEIKIEQNEQKVNEKTDMEQKVNELIAKNKELQENLKHSRKRTRELIKQLREEEALKKMKRDDFSVIHTLLNRYL